MNKFGVGALFISVESGRVLLNLRAPYKTHPLSWALWGGMIEDKETPKEALYRELTEEMSFVPDIEKIYPFDIYDSHDKCFRFYSFVCVVPNEFIPVINKEAVGFAWFDLGIWPKPLHIGAKNTFCKKKTIEKLTMILDQHR